MVKGQTWNLAPQASLQALLWRSTTLAAPCLVSSAMSVAMVTIGSGLMSGIGGIFVPGCIPMGSSLDIVLDRFCYVAGSGISFTFVTEFELRIIADVGSGNRVYFFFLFVKDHLKTQSCYTLGVLRFFGKINLFIVLDGFLNCSHFVLTFELNLIYQMCKIIFLPYTLSWYCLWQVRTQKILNYFHN